MHKIALAIVVASWLLGPASSYRVQLNGVAMGVSEREQEKAQAAMTTTTMTWDPWNASNTSGARSYARANESADLELARLRDENRALRDELERLKLASKESAESNEAFNPIAPSSNRRRSFNSIGNRSTDNSRARKMNFTSLIERAKFNRTQSPFLPHRSEGRKSGINRLVRAATKFPAGGAFEAKLEIGFVNLGLGGLATHWGLIITDIQHRPTAAMPTEWVYEVFGTRRDSKEMSVLCSDGVLAHSVDAPESETDPYWPDGRPESEEDRKNKRYCENGINARTRSQYEKILDLTTKLRGMTVKVDLEEAEKWIVKWVESNPVYDVSNGGRTRTGKNCQQFVHEFIQHLTGRTLQNDVMMNTTAPIREFAAAAEYAVSDMGFTPPMSAARVAEVTPVLLERKRGWELATNNPSYEAANREYREKCIPNKPVTPPEPASRPGLMQRMRSGIRIPGIPGRRT